MNNLEKFCTIVKKRSIENSKSIKLQIENDLYGAACATLRQELDSMVRVLFLLSKERIIREHLLNQFFNEEINKRWKLDGKTVFDRLMVDKASYIHGWASMVYDFCNAFIHLSSFHYYLEDDPFLFYEQEDLQDIKRYMIQNHSFPAEKDITFESMKPYLLNIFNKINDNLDSYLQQLENNPQLHKVQF